MLELGAFMTLRWFYSRTVRHATAMHKHVWKLLQAQKDILSPQATDAINASLDDIKSALSSDASKAELEKQMDNLEKAANKWLKPYPHPVWRENIEVALVALVIAIGIRTFFVQPFKIPTASMQPTLFGVMPLDYSGNQPDLKIPGRVERFFDYWTHGNSYVNVVAPEDGELQGVKQPVRFLLFNLKQEFLFNGKWRSIWFPADNLFERAGYRVDRSSGAVAKYDPTTGEPQRAVFHRGADIIRLKVVAGDHLFVDRLSYNFCRPKRGDIIVFETHDIPGIQTPDTYYIKRLVGLGGENLKLKQDFEVTRVPRSHRPIPTGRLVVNGEELSAGTPHFENLYSFPNATQKTLVYRENGYIGHALLEGLSLGSEFNVRPNHYFVMGDNTMNSSDSRYWGDFPQEKVIGKSFFVYWPISKRFGLGYK